MRSGNTADPAVTHYLGFFGVHTDDPAARELWLRGLALPPAERALARQRLSPAGAPLAALAALYGTARPWQGTLVIGPRGLDAVPALNDLRNSLGDAAAILLDARFLTRITVVGAPGLAAYVPTTGVLVLSRELIDERQALHRFVVIHELTHLAEERARLRDGVEWAREFARLPVTTSPRFVDFRDELTSLSAGSSFSILPDGISPATADRDGHVVRRGYREALARHDESEELADSVAARLVAPARYCFRGRAVAPRRWRWMAREILGHTDGGDGCRHLSSKVP